MIFVATGTTGFDWLVECIDHLAPSLGETKIVQQIGHGQYIPRQTEYFRFAPSLDPYYEHASLVIAHGGLGVCMEVLERGKPLIGLSNADRYDQHQQDLLKALADQNYLIWCQDLNNLAEAIKQAKCTTFKPYIKPECTIHLRVETYLKSLKVNSY